MRLLICTAALAILLGCGLEFPEVPYFETEVQLPVGRVRATALELIRESEFVIGDTTGIEPIAFYFDGEIDTVGVDSLLEVTIPEAEFSASMDRISFDPPEDVREFFRLSDITGAELPKEGVDVVVDPFPLPPLRRELPSQSAFTWLRVGEGTLQLSVRNSLPIPIGRAETSEPSIVVRLYDRATDRVALEVEFFDLLDPGEFARQELDLEGVEVARLLDIEISGESSGSGGETVHVVPTDGVNIVGLFSEILPDSLIAVVDSQTIAIADTIDVDLGTALGVVAGEALVGAIPLSVTNGIPLTASGTLVFPELTENGEPFVLEVELPAARGSEPGLFEESIDLAGRTIRSSDNSPLDRILFQLDLQTRGSAGQIGLGRRQEIVGRLGETPVTFGWAESRADSAEIGIPKTETTLDLPEGVEQIEFEEIELMIEVESTIGLTAQAEIELLGVPGNGAAPVELVVPFSIEAGSPENPVVSRHLFDRSQIPLLDLVRVRPEKIEIEGRLHVGDGSRTARLTGDDWIRGRYEILAPLRAAIERVSYDSTPFDLELSQDTQDRIRNDVVSATVQGTLVNHFPLAVEARAVFASSEGRLDADPEIVLDPVVLAAGEIDPVSGRVQAERHTEFEIALSPDQTRFLARERIWAKFELVFVGDGAQVIEVTARDFAEILAVLILRLGIGDAEANG